MELQGKRKRGRPKMRFKWMKEDMAEVEVTDEDTEDRNNWKGKNPLWRTLVGKAESRRRLLVQNETRSIADQIIEAEVNVLMCLIFFHTTKTKAI